MALALVLVDDVVVAGGEQQGQNWMARDVVDSEPVARSSAPVSDAQHLTELALVGERDLPQVQRAVIVFGDQRNGRRRVVLLLLMGLLLFGLGLVLLFNAG